MHLHALLARSVASFPDRAAVAEAGGTSIDYTSLGRLADRMRDRLVALGVRPGDRVGLYLRKSIDGIASIFGVLQAGAAYVPVDPTAPPTRNAFIHDNCGVKVVVVDRRFEGEYVEALSRLGTVPARIVIDGAAGGEGLRSALDRLDAETAAPPVETWRSAPDDLAYILYTSGSTGTPKGVMLSHHNARAFVDWCTREFEPTSSDVFSSHAPFHFDLSILDIYVPLAHGATCVLIPERMTKEPVALSQVIESFAITVWYSAPSILSLLAQFGQIAEHDYSRLRIVLFAGEVFPITHLRSLTRAVPTPRYFNLYGPTETNVCTYFEVPSHVPDERDVPYPIGRVCSHLEALVVDQDGTPVATGQEGELCIAGPNVMQGYWDLPEQTGNAFIREDGGHRRWYKTGDIVVEETDGVYRYVGRRDRMVKKRGYRVELGEIEACLYRHADVREAAVVAVPDAEAGLKLDAHLSMRSSRKPSIIELKTFCSKSLPVYMVPDRFTFHQSLPKTSTDKIDYVSLKDLR